MSEPTMEVMAQELDRLAWENRQWKSIGVAGLAIIAIGLLMGQAMPGKETKIVEAEKIVLKDPEGKTRAIWGPSQEEGYSLAFYDANGRGRLVLGVDETGPNLGFMDAGETPRIILTMTLKGYPALSLLDTNRKARAELVIGAEGPYLGLYDGSHKKVRAKLALSAKDPLFMFTGLNGKPSAVLSENSLALMDKDGQFRAMLIVASDGTPNALMADRNGKIIWKAPRRQ